MRIDLDLLTQPDITEQTVVERWRCIEKNQKIHWYENYKV
jgi:hypothetical protein